MTPDGNFKVKDEPKDIGNEYGDNSKMTNDPYSWDQWGDPQTSGKTGESMSDDQFLSSLADTIFNNSSGSGHMNPSTSEGLRMGGETPATSTMSAYTSNPGLGPVQRRMTGSATSPGGQQSWTGFSFDTPSHASQEHGNNPHSVGPQSSNQSSRTVSPVHPHASPQFSPSPSNFTSGQVEAALGNKLFGNYNSGPHTVQNFSAFPHPEKHVEFNKTYSMDYSNNPVQFSKNYAPGVTSCQTGGLNVNPVNLNATPLSTLPGHSMSSQQQGSGSSEGQGTTTPGGQPPGSGSGSGPLGSNTEMNSFIEKIVEAGKCLQLLNYRVSLVHNFESLWNNVF